MADKKESTVTWMIVSGFFGIVVFLILLAGLRYLSGNFGNAPFTGIVDFLIANAAILIFFAILSMIAGIFYSFPFPADLPGPVFSGVGILFLTTFIFNVFGYIDRSYTLGLFPGFAIVISLLYPVIFILVLVAGYIRIFTRLSPGDRTGEAVPTPPPGQCEGRKTWDDVGAEFREMMYDGFHRMREKINRK